MCLIKLAAFTASSSIVFDFRDVFLTVSESLYIQQFVHLTFGVITAVCVMSPLRFPNIAGA
jgi:hypothetical protein